MLVMPFSWNVETASNLIAITGGFRKGLDFWASRHAMERSFCEGYQQMVSRIDFHPPMTNLEWNRNPKECLKDVLAVYSNWKSDLGFVQPEVVFERDSVSGLAVIFALILYGIKSNIITLIFLTIVLFFGVACLLLSCSDCMFSIKLGKRKIRYKSKLGGKLLHEDI